ncbi:MAG: D-alanine--D-alanine ligase, partial [Burkholderiales bacterium]
MKGTDFGKVAVLLGGKSAEREISLMSGTAVLEAFKRRAINAHAFDTGQRTLSDLAGENFDRVFIALHGRYGEDGTIQGALELMAIPYTGSGVMASALALDKWRTKLLWSASGIATPDYEMLTAASNFSAVVKKLSLPLIVKPAREGSTIGLSKVTRMQDLEPAYRQAARHDSLVIAEKFISGPEITVSILD